MVGRRQNKLPVTDLWSLLKILINNLQSFILIRQGGDTYKSVTVSAIIRISLCN